MHSMTGYGKGVSKRDGKTITIEIKTVNHRFLDCNFKLPRNFLFVEDKVKKSRFFGNIERSRRSLSHLRTIVYG